MTKNWKKFTAEKKKFLIKNYNLPRPPQSTSKLQKKPSAVKRIHPALQNMKFLNFSTFVGHFCPPRSGSGFRIRIRIHWPEWIWIQFGSGSATLTNGDTLYQNSDNLIGGKILNECLLFPEDLLHALSQVIVHDLAEADMVRGQVLPRNCLQQGV